jgi:hypothetical protein
LLGVLAFAENAITPALHAHRVLVFKKERMLQWLT